MLEFLLGITLLIVLICFLCIENTNYRFNYNVVLAGGTVSQRVGIMHQVYFNFFGLKRILLYKKHKYN